MKTKAIQGFTLIEMSIVLVIIGLITGSILLGQDLVKGATIKAQLNQIEKYQSAVNTFTNKYGALPGDMQPLDAAKYGFTVGTNCTGASVGTRDGNGLIDGWPGAQLIQANGETAFFWSDLSTAGYIDGRFPNSGATIICWNGGGAGGLTMATASQFLPTAKMGRGNNIYVFESSGANWFGLSVLTSNQNSNTALNVIDAYNLDKKADDGQPITGSIQAIYVNGSSTTIANAPTSVTDSTTSCYNTTNNTYSISISGGQLPNCAVSFQMQQ